MLSKSINLPKNKLTFVLTRKCDEVITVTGATDFNGLSRHIKSKESFIKFSRDSKDFSLVR